MSHQTNSDIQSSVANGISQAGFEQLYREHWKTVFAICYHYVRDADLAADLAQNVFEMAWRKRGMLIAGTDIGKYLSRAAKLEAQSHCRNAANRKQLLETAIPAPPPHGNDTEAHIVFRELHQTIETLVSTLPAKSQEVYHLHEDGLDKRSIAVSMAISEKNVEYHLYKTLEYLRRKLHQIC